MFHDYRVYVCIKCRREQVVSYLSEPNVCCDSIPVYRALEWKDEKWEKTVTNLEFINRHTAWSQDIAKMSDEEIKAFMQAKQTEIEDSRIAIVAATHVLKSRGKQTKEIEDELWREKSLSYITPPETQLERLQNKLSKKGETKESIEKISQVLKGIDFSDI